MTLKGVKAFEKKAKTFNEIIAEHLHNSIVNDLNNLFKNTISDSQSSSFLAQNSAACNIPEISAISSSPLTVPVIDYKVCRVRMFTIFKPEI